MRRCTKRILGQDGAGRVWERGWALKDVGKDEATLEYAKRMNRVLDYIAANLHEELTLDQLAQVAGSSKFHFQRQFAAYAGVTVAKLVRLMRFKRASYQLAFNPAYRIIDVALDAGFSSPEAFTRAFKSTYGQTPTEFRADPQWSSWIRQHAHPQPSGNEPMNVSISNFQETKVAVLEHHGSPQSLNASVARFIEWRRESGLSPVASSGTYGVPYADPEQCEPERWHFDICGAVAAEVPKNPQGVITKTIPGGRCAVVEHRGSTDAIGATVKRLYAEWLPSSGEQLRDFPCFFEYVERMPAVSEHEQRTLVRLPLR